MPRTLVLTGSLAPQALERRLAEVADGAVVLEYDTLLDRGQYPGVAAWLSTRDIFGRDAAMPLLAGMTEAMDPYLRPRPELGDRPGDADLRKAALGGEFQDRMSMRLFNLALRDHLWGRFEFDRIVVCAGSGVSFGFWREVAAEKGLAVECLAPEWRSRSLRRRFQRWLCRWRRAPAAVTAETVARPAAQVEAPLVLCASGRVARLLAREPTAACFRLQTVAAAELGEPAADMLAADTAHWAEWWRRWQTEVLDTDPAVSGCRDIHQAMGESYTPRVYPRWSALVAKAMARLRELQPALVLADTQIGAEDGVWSLAAARLGIPVASYTYDFLLKPRTMFTPDFALVDGQRGIPMMTAAGYPAERILEVRGHRRSSLPPRTPEQVESAFNRRRPQVLYADTMTVITDPQACLHQYRLIVETARRLPEFDFIIKFHPLRAPKSEERGFIGMDESEVQSKSRFLRSLGPPANVRLAPPEQPMEEVMQSAAVLLNTISVSGHEAFHLGLPVVFLVRHPADFFLFPELDQRLQPPCGENAEELVQALTRLFGDRAHRQAVVAAQHRYQKEFFWSSERTLTEAVNFLLKRAWEVPS
jgi:hypothetical protein